MTTVLFAFGLMLLIVAGMALGVMFGRQPIKGSCGGMGALGINSECEICGGNPARCEVGSSADAEPVGGVGGDAQVSSAQRNYSKVSDTQANWDTTKSAGVSTFGPATSAPESSTATPPNLDSSPSDT